MGAGNSVCFDGGFPDLDALPPRPLHRATVRMLKQLLDLHGEVGAAEWAHIAKVGGQAPNASALIGLQRALRGRDPGVLLAAFISSGPERARASRTSTCLGRASRRRCASPVRTN